jgi:hypothetical protein
VTGAGEEGEREYSVCVCVRVYMCVLRVYIWRKTLQKHDCVFIDIHSKRAFCEAEHQAKKIEGIKIAHTQIGWEKIHDRYLRGKANS